MYIILDVEFNGRKFASELPQEILEIGAVKLGEALEITDQFEAVVKPVYYSKLNRFVKQKTGITQEEIDSAQGFPAVFEQFRERMLREDFVFVTWGGEDAKVMLQDLKFHRIDFHWSQNPLYIDLLAAFKTVFELKNDMNLKDAAALCGFEWEGNEHRALSDAVHTTLIFKHIYDRIKPEPKLFVENALNKKIRNWLKTRVKAHNRNKNMDVEAFYASQEFADFVEFFKIKENKLEKVKQFVDELRAESGKIQK